jgi:chromosome segregation ATPase
MILLSYCLAAPSEHHVVMASCTVRAQAKISSKAVNAVRYIMAQPSASPVLQDSGTAKKLAFAREVSQRCITLEGDDFNPGGLLTGGSRGSGRSLLLQLHELLEAEQRLATHQQRLAEVEATLREKAPIGKQYQK